jgi:hypothetical protein
MSKHTVFAVRIWYAVLPSAVGTLVAGRQPSHRSRPSRARMLFVSHQTEVRVRVFFGERCHKRGFMFLVLSWMALFGCFFDTLFVMLHSISVIVGVFISHSSVASV